MAYNRIAVLLLVSFSALLPVPGAAAVEEAPVGFDEFAGRFPAHVQDAARAVWGQIEPVEFAEAAATAGAVSDDDLLAALESEKAASLRRQLEGLHAELSTAAAARNEAFAVHGRWQAFADQIANSPDLGAVYLEALKVVDAWRRRLEEAAMQVQRLEKRVADLRVDAALGEISKGFTLWDWMVIAAYLVMTTILGGLLAGKQASMKDFFLGGRRLPWPAVCGSIIATELSAATFLIAPAIVFSQGGDMTYIQLAIGTILARFVIGYFFIPVYYKKEIYSPYDYMGDQLGSRVRHVTTGLFMVGGILAQGARVYIAAKALQVITGTDTTTSILIIGAVSVLWTIMGGITTVIWTDAIQFLLFTGGAIAALIFATTAVEGGAVDGVFGGVPCGEVSGD